MDPEKLRNQERGDGVGARVETELDRKQRIMLEFAGRKIEDAAKVVDRLLTDGKIDSSDIYMREVDDPETRGVIDGLQEGLGWDSEMIGLVSDRVDELKRERETQRKLESLSEKIAGRKFSPLTTPDQRGLVRDLEEGIDERSVEKVSLALRGMGAMSERELKELVSVASSPDEVALLFRMVGEKFENLEHEADGRVGG